MFRIERRLVNLGAARPIRADNDLDPVVEAETPEDDFDAPFPDPVISAQEIIDDARERASNIIKEAREERAAIILASKEDAEAERQKAWNVGYSEGSEEGKRSYDEILSKNISENNESLKRVVKEIRGNWDLTYSKLEKDVLDLSFQIVKKIISPAEETIGGVFESLIKNALKQIAPEGKITLRVSMADYDRFFSSGNAVFNLEGGIQVTASVLRDTSLNEYDCVIDTESSTVNAGLDTQLSLIELAFSNE